jgi:hypothetical protein
MFSTNVEAIGKWALVSRNWTAETKKKRKLVEFHTGFLFIALHDIHLFHRVMNPASALKQYKTNISLNYTEK